VYGRSFQKFDRLPLDFSVCNRFLCNHDAIVMADNNYFCAEQKNFFVPRCGIARAFGKVIA
jgi:hypothetical protein